MDNEIWKTIPFEDNYEVSDRGKVRNKDTKHIKSLRKDRYGYQRVTLYPSGKTYTIHRLVLLSFMPEKQNESINHINGDKEDNTIENLEWCTTSYNSLHRDTVLQSKWKGSMNPSAKVSIDIARKIKYSDWGSKSNRQIGEIFGLQDEAVRLIRNGTNWRHI